MSAYAGDITMIVSDISEIEMFGTSLEEYKMLTGAESEYENNGEIVARHLERQVHVAQQRHCALDGSTSKIAWIWFGPDLSVDKK